MTERGIENKIQELEMQLSTTVLVWSAGGSVDTGVLQGGKQGGRENGETEHSPPPQNLETNSPVFCHLVT